jgi:hypothetical protein
MKPNENQRGKEIKRTADENIGRSHTALQQENGRQCHGADSGCCRVLQLTRCHYCLAHQTSKFSEIGHLSFVEKPSLSSNCEFCKNDLKFYHVSGSFQSSRIDIPFSQDFFLFGQIWARVGLFYYKKLMTNLKPFGFHEQNL